MPLLKKPLQKKVYLQVQPRLIPGTQAWWEMRARQAGFRDLAHAREQRILGAGFKSVAAYERFARAPKRTPAEYYRALAEATGKTVQQAIAEARQRQLRKGAAGRQ